MILSFKHKGLEELYRHDSIKGVQARHVPKLLRILDILDIATSPKDLQIPEFKTHKLQGKKSGFYSVWITGNWRVTFRFIGTNVELVDYIDYH